MDEDPKAAKRKDLRKVRREAAGYSKEIALLKKQLAIHKRQSAKILAAFGGGRKRRTADEIDQEEYRSRKAAERAEDRRQAKALGTPHETLRDIRETMRRSAQPAPKAVEQAKPQPPPLPQAKPKPPPLPKPMFARTKAAPKPVAPPAEEQPQKPMFQSRVKSAFKPVPAPGAPSSKIPVNTPIRSQPMSREDVAYSAGLKRQVIGGDHAPAPHVPAPREGLAHRAGAATGSAVRKTSQAVGKAVQSVKQAPTHIAQKASGAVKSLASGAMSKILRAKSALGFKPKLAKEDPRFAVETGSRGGRFYMNSQGTKVYVK